MKSMITAVKKVFPPIGYLVAAFLLFGAIFQHDYARAQQQQRQATPVEMNGAMQAAIEQGNVARSMHIQAEAKAAGLADELAKAQAKIKELEAKAAEKK